MSEIYLAGWSAGERRMRLWSVDNLGFKLQDGGAHYGMFLVPQLPAAEPITPAADPTALLRSLGDPPLQGQGQVAEHYIAAVIERAAMLATALAASAGLRAPDDDAAA